MLILFYEISDTEFGFENHSHSSSVHFYHFFLLSPID